VVGPLECVTGALQNPIDAAGADPRAEQLLARLHVSRRETRFLTASVATAACNREPNALVATSAGSSPVRSTPHCGQRARMHRCSITPTASLGSSST
jgi:hypothetical protein